MLKRWYEDENFYNGSRSNDEYYESYCSDCDDTTEHDVCTDRCVDCYE